ncbi:glycosyltransferase family protein [Rothia nasimurium]|uniref:glycosyltransferase family protein n=1 Tax=Rothia nasimurium TaxID=85336 RepID=UPI003BA37CBF
MSMSSIFQHYRRAAWHARQGGLRQLRRYLASGHKVSPQLTEYRKSLEAGRVALSDQAFAAVPARIPINSPAGYALDYLPSAPLNRPKPYGHVTVATILDDFSQMAWGYEFNAIPLEPATWEETLAEVSVDLLFVESAWAGQNGKWRGRLTGAKAPSSEIIALVEYCKKKGIPTVFWNKEDPPHFNDFLQTAALFDQVFTTDVRMVPRYVEELGHENIDVLPFAAQPAVHNPVRPVAGVQDRGVAFAGSYFAHKYPERKQQMDFILKGASVAAGKSYMDFEIYSRFIGSDDKYQFPDEYKEHVVGAVPYEQILTAYKAHKVFLNVNSVIDSPSMCARRIFEILASGTPVVTAPSAAVGEFFREDELVVVHDERDTELSVRALLNSSLLRDRFVHRAQRRIWQEHTYTQRATKVLKSVGLDSLVQERATCEPLVSILCSTIRPHQIENLVENVARQEYSNVELLVATHGFTLSDEEINKFQNLLPGKPVKFISVDGSKSLGECLNFLIDNAHGEIFSKMDDDDYYAKYYLYDLVNILRITGADVTGKHARHIFIDDYALMLLYSPRTEHMWSDFVAGPTITGRAEVFRSVRFKELTIGEDTDFLNRVRAKGFTIYASDRFNFVQMRADKSKDSSNKHTWTIDAHELLANSNFLYKGKNLEGAEV